MWTATDAWTTLTCCGCCSRSALQATTSPKISTRDGIVDDADLLQVLFNFGSGC
jgi:hypothetical protein